jgi:hypothetical protein
MTQNSTARQHEMRRRRNKLAKWRAKQVEKTAAQPASTPAKKA